MSYNVGENSRLAHRPFAGLGHSSAGLGHSSAVLNDGLPKHKQIWTLVLSKFGEKWADDCWFVSGFSPDLKQEYYIFFPFFSSQSLYIYLVTEICDVHQRMWHPIPFTFLFFRCVWISFCATHPLYREKLTRKYESDPCVSAGAWPPCCTVDTGSYNDDLTLEGLLRSCPTCLVPTLLQKVHW